MSKNAKIVVAILGGLGLGLIVVLLVRRYAPGAQSTASAFNCVSAREIGLQIQSRFSLSTFQVAQVMDTVLAMPTGATQFIATGVVGRPNIQAHRCSETEWALL